MIQGRAPVERSSSGAAAAAGPAPRAQNLSRARGAKQTTHHGPLQRLLGGFMGHSPCAPGNRIPNRHFSAGICESIRDDRNKNAQFFSTSRHSQLTR
jgi:hypothetical protein